MKSLSDIVNDVYSNDATGMTKDQINKVASSVLGSISDALEEGEEVRLHNFGTFSLASRGARMGRNPATGESIQIAASTNVKFKASKALKDRLG